MLTVYIIAALGTIALLNAIIFHFLLNRQLSIKECFKLTSVATALNKCLFTGTGYLASSYFSRHKNVSFYRALSAFIVLEVMGVFLWVVLGIFFGARLALDLPLVLVIMMFFVALIIRRKKHKLASSIRGYKGHFKAMGRRILVVIPFAVLGTCVNFIYHILIFRIFDLQFGIMTMLKIVSVAFAVGYLSFSPAGLGFKEAGIVLLLMDQGVAFETAAYVALLDRIMMAVFFGVIAAVVGVDLIKEEFARRFKKEDEKEGQTKAGSAKTG